MRTNNGMHAGKLKSIKEGRLQPKFSIATSASTLKPRSILRFHTMHFFIPAARAISFVFALLVAASTASALPRTVEVVAVGGKYFPRYNWCNPNTSWP